jgi:hypothetical protein
LKDVRADEPKSSEKSRISCSRLTDHTRFTATPKVGGVPLLNFEPLHRPKAIINTGRHRSPTVGILFRNLI